MVFSNRIKHLGVLFAAFLFITLLSSVQQKNVVPPIKVTKVSTDKKYGKKPKTAIQVGTVGNEYDYLDQLCGPNGEKITYKRTKSCCEFDCPECDMGRGLLDQWSIEYMGIKKPMVIYLNGYRYKDPKAPKGLELKSNF